VGTWLASSNYPQRRRETLMKEYTKFTESQLSKTDKSISKIKAFIKDESYSTFKHARGIYSRTDVFKTLFGPVCKLIENDLYKSEYFAKHIPVDEKPSVIKERFGGVIGEKGKGIKQRIIGTDYTAFESHFTPEVMEHIEFQLYDYMTQHLPEGKDFMRLCRKVIAGRNRIAFRDLKLELLACRMSGEMNTSLGNGFSNLMIFLYLTQDCIEVDCLIEGDDCLGKYIGEELSIEDYARLRFTVKIDYYEHANLASFCGQIFDNESSTVITDPTKIMLNCSWGNAKYVGASNKTHLRLLRSKALSMIHQYPGCPIVQEFALYLLRVTHGLKRKIDNTESFYMQKALEKQSATNLPTREVSFSSRELMEEVFSYSIDEQLCLENYFRNKHSVGSLAHPVIYDHCTPNHFEYDNRYVVPLNDVYGFLSYDMVQSILVLKELRKLIDV